MLCKLSNELLHKKILDLVQTERSTTTEILQHLQEIERRRLFCDFGYGSLIEYAVKELKYSESSAYRRIQAMRMLKALPAIEDKIEDGTLSLSNLAKAQSFIKAVEKKEQRKVSASEKQNMLVRIENQSQRRVDQLIAEMSPDLVCPQKDRPISDNRVLLSFSVSKESRKKLQRLEELSGKPHGLEVLFNMMLDCTLEKFEKKRGVKVAGAKAIVQASTAMVNDCVKVEATKSKTKVARKYISIHTKRQIWQRAGARCEHINANNRQRCHQRRFLQLDHIFPLSKGGENMTGNLQLLCSAHNLAKGDSA